MIASKVTGPLLEDVPSASVDDYREDDLRKNDAGAATERSAPAAAGTEVPLATEADLSGEIQCHVNGGEQRLGITEVRALVEVDAF